MAPLPEFLPGITGFQWDEGNAEKNWSRHGVNQAEAEQVFFNNPVFAPGQVNPSGTEARYFALGETEVGRRLGVVFILRGTLIRVISVRPMSRRERRLYAQEKNA